MPDPDEYIKIAGAQLRPKDGRLSVKFAEPMEEVIYLDQIAALRDRSPGRLGHLPARVLRRHARRRRRPRSSSPGGRGCRWAPGTRRAATCCRRCASATDATSRVSAAPAFKGFAALHALELDLGELPANGPVRLIMAGFTDYFTATSVFAAHQAGVTAVVPYLEALLPDGTWKKVSDDIGFPAGLRRTMTADLTGKLPPGTRRIRIWTNLKVYWDQVLIDTTAAGRGAVGANGGAAPGGVARLSRVPARGHGHAGGRSHVRARPGEPSTGRTPGTAASTRGTATCGRSSAPPTTGSRFSARATRCRSSSTRTRSPRSAQAGRATTCSSSRATSRTWTSTRRTPRR